MPGTNFKSDGFLPAPSTLRNRLTAGYNKLSAGPRTALWKSQSGGLSMLRRLISNERISLADEPAFSLGDVFFDPSRLTIRRGKVTRQVESRVMMVLVALAEADGCVVSRDDLVERCWDGRIVADNAIQRVISRIRALSANLGGFEVHTVTKVGYLLKAEGAEDTYSEGSEPVPQPAPPPDPAQEKDRRGFLVGAGAFAIAAIGGAAIWRLGNPPDAHLSEAEQLIVKAHEAELTGLPESSGQSIAYLVRATEVDPGSAEAWGALALARQKTLDSVEQHQIVSVAAWAESAARRALQIDPANFNARLALATIRPNFRNWAANERALLALKAPAASGEYESALGWLLCDTGRWREAIVHFRRALAIEPYHPANQMMLAWGLWGAGELVEADTRLDDALRLWPKSFPSWQTRFDFLLTTGRSAEAVALVEDTSARPALFPDQPPPDYAFLSRIAKAVEDPAADRTGLVQAIVDAPNISYISAIAYLCVFGAVDPCFAILESFFFGGRGWPPPGSYDRRKTSIFFSEKAALLRRDPRHQALIRRIGLDDYWRETGTRPDISLTR
ncbi:hypothetical protein FJQ54_00325 [Sandaracinobacter neustonicus]|uniref:OmpR/PhoB-type domain-containing protein n=1 Tax=Sandaracinobacter neustonicus TaxID=1715348 RepID=A0A501XXI5_9SPHN|nr:winged helix-turn-helix domain-containing protein [Sandaracinobacter neustonicus]TPE65073.1 hypothetical protein FJQ54_00325 [Sandaracinobacter neustonicus]